MAMSGRGLASGETVGGARRYSTRRWKRGRGAQPSGRDRVVTMRAGGWRLGESPNSPSRWIWERRRGWRRRSMEVVESRNR